MAVCRKVPAEPRMGEAPRPRSPPRYPDLCGRRRLQLEVQVLNREVGFLEVLAPCLSLFLRSPAGAPCLIGKRAPGPEQNLREDEKVCAAFVRA